MALPLYGLHDQVRGRALVDAENYLALAGFRWNLRRDGYASRHVSRKLGGGTMLLHRHILGLEIGDPRECDHINRNGLDNRRVNLRVVTHAQNRQNTPALRGTSRHRGVCWHPRAGRWQAQVQIDGRQNYLGLFDDEDDAARAASAYRAEHMPFAVEP